MNTFEFIKKQVWEPLEKQPGWVYLAFAVYLGVHALSLGGLSDELWVVILTPVFYWIGDGIDSALFKKSDKTERFPLCGLCDVRKKARDALLVQDGVYEVLMKLLAESGEPRHKAQVHFQNELAKFARSAAVPVCLLGIYLAVTRDTWFVALVGLSALLMVVAFYLKLRHMRTLYSLTEWLRRPPKYAVHNIDVEGAGSPVRLFFWEGKLIASAMLELDEKKRTGAAVLIEQTTR
jgi:hypothetical protein